MRERGALSLEEGVRRITSMPAEIFGLRDRGIAWSFVNGHPVIAEGRVPKAPPGRGPGRVLRVA